MNDCHVIVFANFIMVYYSFHYFASVLFVGFMLVINVCFSDVSFFALFYETEPETEPMQTSC